MNWVPERAAKSAVKRRMSLREIDRMSEGEEAGTVEPKGEHSQVDCADLWRVLDEEL